MIPYNAISDLLADGKTPAQIAALLAVQTNRPILVADLENYVFQNGIARRNGKTGEWQGPLIDAMGNENFPAELRDGIEELMSFINLRNSVSIDTTKEPRASQNAGLLPGLVAIGVITQSQAGDVLALAGGYKYPGINEAAVQAAIDAEAKRVVIEAARTQVNSRTTAINGWLDTIDTSLSVTEIESYIADLLSSEDGNPTQGGE
jgi:hypothetical protein